MRLGDGSITFNKNVGLAVTSMPSMAILLTKYNQQPLCQMQLINFIDFLLEENNKRKQFRHHEETL